ncbi:hypothetical protein K470DRAFT_99401 [Piedraia hortae CBS 480.64]|uniref:N-acetylglucosamine-induced protein 1 n=1 Tax=Piedraia hortae CBS 480.64 TaxID=1314780 RepID=A0A6A7BW29_9PEZI|nr:hypothetical protein K470DRAFT_99401 [Piedraia hortae CBS 480.64]
MPSNDLSHNPSQEHINEPNEHPSTPPNKHTQFWNTNLPPTLQTPTCPPYLLYALSNPKDLAILSTPESSFPLLDWPTILAIVETNSLEKFIRTPLSLLKYRAYCHEITNTHGSVMNYMLRERLNWTEPVTPRGGLFEDSRDCKVLRNDWPYAVQEGVVHLVVWTKFPLEEEEGGQGRLKPEVKEKVEGFVKETFGSEGVVWFKNWAALKSVHAIEHFHVLLLRPDEGFVRRVTGEEGGGR